VVAWFIAQIVPMRRSVAERGPDFARLANGQISRLTIMSGHI